MMTRTRKMLLQFHFHFSIVCNYFLHHIENLTKKTSYIRVQKVTLFIPAHRQSCRFMHVTVAFMKGKYLCIV